MKDIIRIRNGIYLLLCNSNDGSASLWWCPCAVHIRPIRDGTVSPVVLPAIDDAFEFILGRAPVGFGSLDEVVERSLVTERSDGVGDGARSDAADASDTFGSFVSLIFH